MKKCIISLFLVFVLAMPASASMEFEAPAVPESGASYMPKETQSFGKDLWYIIKTAIYDIRPEVAQTAGQCLSVIGIMLLTSLLVSTSEKTKRMTEFVQPEDFCSYIYICSYCFFLPFLSHNSARFAVLLRLPEL